MQASLWDLQILNNPNCPGEPIETLVTITLFYYSVGFIGSIEKSHFSTGSDFLSENTSLPAAKMIRIREQTHGYMKR